MKLSRTLHDVGYAPTKADPELEMLLQNGELKAVVAKHAEDVHMGASPETTRKTRQAVEKVFVPLTWSEREFVSVGVHHVHHTNGTVELDQDAYIEELNPITGPSLLWESC